jgi:hypothetical protein
MRIAAILVVAGALAISVAAGSAAARPPIMPMPPIPGPGWVRVWVPPEYRTVYEQVWVEERTERVQERIWVAATGEWREVVYYDEWGRRCVRREWVETSPGYWTYQWRTVVIPAHYETVSRQVLVREGYWKWVRVDPPLPVPDPLPQPRPLYGNPPRVGVEGYQSGNTGEDLSKFSPLYDWPDSKK